MKILITILGVSLCSVFILDCNRQPNIFQKIDNCTDQIYRAYQANHIDTLQVVNKVEKHQKSRDSSINIMDMNTTKIENEYYNLRDKLQKELSSNEHAVRHANVNQSNNRSTKINVVDKTPEDYARVIIKVHSETITICKEALAIAGSMADGRENNKNENL
jgi:hypothetical protein